MDEETANNWKLYYWPKLAGRAEFVRVLFEEAGVQFEEINDLEVLVPMFRESKVDKFSKLILKKMMLRPTSSALPNVKVSASTTWECKTIMTMSFFDNE